MRCTRAYAFSHSSSSGVASQMQVSRHLSFLKPGPAWDNLQMSSSARIDAAFPAPGAASTSTVTSGGWAVDYDWVNDRVVTAGVPRRLTFPAPFDRDLTGVLPGQASFTASRYVFGSGSYLRLRAADGVPDAAAAPIAPAWGLPAAWTAVDAVFGGGGVKSGFA